MRPLIAQEEEQLVLLDGAAESAAELIALQSIPGRGGAKKSRPLTS